MKQFLCLILFLCCGLAGAQVQVSGPQHIYPAEDTSNFFSGPNYFLHLDGDYIVTPNGYASIQAALTDACASTQNARVVVSASSLSLETVSNLTGCNKVVVEDARPAVADVYKWNGSVYVKQGYVPNLSTVATSGNYNDLSNTPTISKVGHTGQYADLLGLPGLSAVATSGSYSDLLNKPTISAVGHSGQYTDLLGVPSINLNSINTSGDMGQTINAADAQYAGQKIVFETTQPSTISTPFTLSSGHRLEYHADVIQKATGSLGSNTAVQCFGSTIDATSFALGTGYVYTMAPDTHSVQFNNCTMVSNYDIALYDSGPSVDVTMQGNYFHNTWGFLQNSAAASDPTLRFNFLNNNVVQDSPSGTPGVIMYGATQNSLFAQNHFVNTLHGVELYAGDAGVNFPHPTTAVIQSLGLRNNILALNNCDTITDSCLWVSMGDAITFIANTAHNCGDPCFDQEGSSNFLIQDNVADGIQGDGAGYYTVFYSAHDGVMSNNRADSSGNYGFAIWENDQSNPSFVSDLAFSNNKFVCLAAGGCPWFRADSNQDTILDSNKITNGVIDSPGYSRHMIIKNNTIKTNLSGNVNGLTLPNANGGTKTWVENNHIYNEGGGTGPCISGGSSDFNNVDQFIITGNNCEGFTSDGYVVNSGGNVGNIFEFRNNYFGTGTITTSPASNAPVQIIKTNNCLPGEANNPCQH